MIETYLGRLSQYRHLYVGFSGGLDSTVLLHLLASNADLQDRVVAVHVHHGLSGFAKDWQIHCQRVCDELNIPFIVREVEFDRAANIEERARTARYEVFSSLLTSHDVLLLGHHADDQAETVLLQLIRGTGIDGLAAMPVFKKIGKGELIRPLLSCSRRMLNDYALLHHLVWIEDESNQNESFSRNYLRHQIMPQLQEKWPFLVSNLARTAAHCQQAIGNLDALAQIDCAEVNKPATPLSLVALRRLSAQRVTNVLRTWIKKNNIRMPSTVNITRIIDELIFSDSQACCVAWGQCSVYRYQDMLHLVMDNIPVLSYVEWSSFPVDLFLKEKKSHLQVKMGRKGLHVPLFSKVIVGFRQGKETIRLHGQTKTLKKLLQEWRIPPWLRSQIPLIYINGNLAAVVGFAISDDYFICDGDNAYMIREVC